MPTTADRPDDHTCSTAHRDDSGPDRIVPEVSAADTGTAHAVDGGTAATGHREPAAGPDAASMASVQVRGTGDAIANGPHAVAVSGDLTVVERLPRQQPAAWPHQVGVIPVPIWWCGWECLWGCSLWWSVVTCSFGVGWWGEGCRSGSVG